MFKIFINNRVLALSSRWDACADEPNLISYKVTKKSEIPDVVNHFLHHTQTQILLLVAENPVLLFEQIKQLFDYLEAAGGFVKNKQNEVLMIFRNNHWDLPKGRCEPNESIEETALREVEEECAIVGLQLYQPMLTETFHIYQEAEKYVLKRTAWFRMDYFGAAAPKPQTIEGITKAEFIPLEKLPEVLPSVYRSINEVFRAAGMSKGNVGI